jgi:hypothetical protein
MHTCTHLMLNKCFWFFINLNIPEICHIVMVMSFWVVSMCSSSLYLSSDMLYISYNFLVSLVVVSMEWCSLSICAYDKNKWPCVQVNYGQILKSLSNGFPWPWKYFISGEWVSFSCPELHGAENSGFTDQPVFPMVSHISVLIINRICSLQYSMEQYTSIFHFIEV